MIDLQTHRYISNHLRELNLVENKNDNLKKIIIFWNEKLKTKTPEVKAVKKGNYSRSHLSKLTKENVLRIRELSKEGVKGIQIAKIFKISNSTISKVINRELYTNI